LPEEVRHGRSELTNEEYWSDVWRSSDLPPAVDPDSTPFFQYFCGFLKDSLNGWSGSLLEVGCASSRWLPYFAGLGFSVAGIDYSRLGCEQARRILEREHVEGDIYERDAFDANSDLVGRFDVVVSLGVVEHFQDTTEPVRAFARYLKPRGLMISTCPNMTGVLGLSQKILNRSVYDCHVPLTTGRLRQAHEMAGLTVANCTYIGSPDFHMLNLQGVKGAKDLAYRVLMRLSRIGWELPVRIKPGQMLSSAVGCAAYQNPLPS
jgi:2-polyprenyl-3-methyl-5-hydroxy-6-metoxy-1,4-benzoquinol methylase